MSSAADGERHESDFANGGGRGDESVVLAFALAVCSEDAGSLELWDTFDEALLGKHEPLLLLYRIGR